MKIAIKKPVAGGTVLKIFRDIILAATMAFFLPSLLNAVTFSQPEHYIYPGLTPHTAHWNDTDGNRIEAHSAGMFQVGGSEPFLHVLPLS